MGLVVTGAKQKSPLFLPRWNLTRRITEAIRAMRHTDRIRPDTDFDPEAYVPASKLLYRSLAGGTKVYFEFHPSMLRQDSVGEIYVVDPRGNSYALLNRRRENRARGFPDLWSTRGGTTASAMSQWVTNW